MANGYANSEICKWGLYSTSKKIRTRNEENKPPCTARGGERRAEVLTAQHCSRSRRIPHTRASSGPSPQPSFQDLCGCARSCGSRAGSQRPAVAGAQWANAARGLCTQSTLLRRTHWTVFRELIGSMLLLKIEEMKVYEQQ